MLSISGLLSKAATGTLNHCLGERTNGGCGERVGFLLLGVEPRIAAPPVIKDLLDRPWNTLAVIAA